MDLCRSVQGETRVVLAANQDIAPGEELTYNYQDDTLDGFVERQKCNCGARRSVMLDPRSFLLNSFILIGFVKI